MLGRILRVVVLKFASVKQSNNTILEKTVIFGQPLAAG